MYMCFDHVHFPLPSLGPLAPTDPFSVPNNPSSRFMIFFPFLFGGLIGLLKGAWVRGGVKSVCCSPAASRQENVYPSPITCSRPIDPHRGGAAQASSPSFLLVCS